MSPSYNSASDFARRMQGEDDTLQAQRRKVQLSYVELAVSYPVAAMVVATPSSAPSGPKWR